MSSMLAAVNKILTFSCVDGPGNRLVIFFQGCNYQCLTCHNPYTMKQCNNCGDCIDVCPEQALSKNVYGQIIWDENICTQCDKCLDACSFSSTPKAKHYSAIDLIEIIRENHLFISGITLSGGEATVQLPFLVTFLSLLREDQQLSELNCLLDTNGSIGIKSWNKLLPLIDGVMLDIKSWGSENHVELTGAKNTNVKLTLDYLSATNKLVEVRLLLIPSKTDYDAHLDELADVLKNLPNETTIRINAFHNHGVQLIAKTWPVATKDHVDDFIRKLNNKGVSNIISPSAIYS